MQVADFNQFGSAKPGSPGDPQHCAQCEAMLTDALDGTLSAADQATFDLHMVGCPACATMLADAQRGAAWMEMLKSPRPEPPASLVERILARTSNPPEPAIVLGPTDRLRVPPPQVPNTLLGQPTLVPAATFYAPTNVLPFRARFTHGLRSIGHTLLQPRLAMTAAMAFFSIALTMNLTGVHLSNLHASDLKPSSILRSCYETKARVVRYSDNLRVVYELESRVRDLQRSSDENASPSTAPAPQNTPAPQNPDGSPQPDSQNPGSKNPDKKQNRSRPNPGSSRREGPAGNLLLVQYAKLHSVAAASPQAFVFAPSSIFKQEGGLV
jgi:Putative zinc-finger